jgi:hypothetical protein
VKGVNKDWPISCSKRRFLDIKQVIRNLRSIKGLVKSFSLIPCGLNLDKYTLNDEIPAVTVKDNNRVTSGRFEKRLVAEHSKNV